MHYALGYTFSCMELFEFFPFDKLHITEKESNKFYKQSRIFLVMSIFMTCLKLIINDIIDNGVTFNLPTNKRKSCIYIKRITGPDYKKGRQNGKWLQFDLYKTNFSGYSMVFEYDTKAVRRTKSIFLNPEYRDRIVNNVNDGVKYF